MPQSSCNLASKESQAGSPNSPNIITKPSYKLLSAFRYAKATDIILICIAIALIIISSLWLPIYGRVFASFIELFFDWRENPSNESNFITLLVTLIVTSFVVIFSFLLSRSLMHFAARRQVSSISKKYLDVLVVDTLYGVLPSSVPEKLGTTFEKDCKVLLKALGPSMANFLWTISSITGTVVGSLFWNWRISLFLIVLFPITAIALKVFRDTISDSGAYFSQIYAKADHTVKEILRNIKSVIALGGEYKESERYKQKLFELETKVNFHFLWQALALAGSSFLFFASYATILYIGNLFAKNHTLGGTYGWTDMLSIAFCVCSCIPIVHCAVPCLNAFAKAQSVLNNIFQTIESKPSNQEISSVTHKRESFLSSHNKESSTHTHTLLIQNTNSQDICEASDLSKTKSETNSEKALCSENSDTPLGKAKKSINYPPIHIPEPLNGKILLHNVTLMCQKKHSEPIFENLNLEIQPQTTIAIVIKDDDSGVWTNGFFKLLQGVYKPSKGIIMLDNQDLQTFTQERLRASIMEISHEPLIFPVTLRENLTFMKPELKDEELFQKIEAMGLDGFFAPLKEKLDRVICYDEVQLTLQEKQIVGIVRAILVDPQLFLVDGRIFEGLNSQRIGKVLQKMSIDKTMIIVCPPTRTIKGVDRLLVIDDEKIEELGTTKDKASPTKIKNRKWIIEDAPKGILKNERRSTVKTYRHTERSSLSAVDIKVDLVNNDDENASFIEKVNTEDLRHLNEALGSYDDSYFTVPATDSMEDCQERLWQLVQAQGGAYLYALLPMVVNSVLIPLLLILVSKMTILMISSSGSLTVQKTRITFAEILLLGVIIFCCYFIGISKLMWFRLRSGNIMRKQIFLKMLRMHVAWHHEPENSPENLAKSLKDDVNQAINTISLNQSLTIQLVLNIAIAMLMTIFTSAQLGLITLFLLLILAGISSVMDLLKKKYTKQYEESSDALKQFITGGFNNIATVQKLPDHSFFPDFVEKLTKKTMSAKRKIDLCTEIFVSFGFLAIFVNLGAVATVGLLMHLNGEIGIEKVLVCLLVPVFTLLELFKFQFMMIDSKKTSEACEKISKYFDAKTSIDIEDKTLLYRGPINGDIEFRNVTFTYPGNRVPALKNVSFKVSATKHVAIVGDEKSGKKAISELLLRLYDVDGGEILVDDVNVKHYKLHYLRKKIGAVFTQPYVFEGTMEQNIKYAEEYIPKLEVRDVSKKAGIVNFKEGAWVKSEASECSDFVNKSEVDEKIIANEDAVPIGQKYRINIARMLLRRPIIFLFEVFQNESECENCLGSQEKIKKLIGAGTGLIIRDTYSVEEGYDKVIILKHGKVVEAEGEKEAEKNKEILGDI